MSVESVQRAGGQTGPVEQRMLSEPIHALGSILLTGITFSVFRHARDKCRAHQTLVEQRPANPRDEDERDDNSDDDEKLASHGDDC